MKKYHVQKYTTENYDEWNEFVAKAKNATFLFHRDFMEYHQDRFEDYSLLLFDETQKLRAIFPANRVGTVLYSHQGLTYGGLVFETNHNPIFTPKMVNSLLLFLIKESFTEVKIKIIPTIYNKSNTQEFDCYLHEVGAELLNREMNLIIDLRNEWKLSKSKFKHFKKAEAKLEMIEEDDLSLFWNDVLIPRLSEKYDANPVHSLNEIQQLKEKFNSNIVQYSAYHEDGIVAGITIFKFNKVIKSQYGATTKAGEKLRALDFLFISLIQKFKNEGYLYFDMGTVSNNEGLLNQKIELGCDVFTNDFYCIKL
ncbi:acetyltransferase (GNAT) family protein [Flavobacterium aquaticum]|uniref:Acetyltransferase (GNAT) family protein n=1 Tax=Flavobacterium aquaticum TaxID=1236486 RepID=A0A327YS05_9FLAO|nr:GNAT family N-acetyltransferase [Flavobacterium aquaticum]RAK22505.1 acetyltransferase (GNAT) family protein [Flavobacterium aquaticum]